MPPHFLHDPHAQGSYKLLNLHMKFINWPVGKSDSGANFRAKTKICDILPFGDAQWPSFLPFVMAELVPAIHVFGVGRGLKAWMPGTRPGMTS